MDFILKLSQDLIWKNVSIIPTNENSFCPANFGFVQLRQFLGIKVESSYNNPIENIFYLGFNSTLSNLHAKDIADSIKIINIFFFSLRKKCYKTE